MLALRHRTRWSAVLSTASALLALAVAPVAGAAPRHHVEHPRRASAHAAIVGGEPADVGAWTPAAFIADIGADGGDGVGVCTGMVVAPNLVLTAAHCAEDVATGQLDDVSGFRIITGSVDWTNQAARQVSGVSQSIIYPGFDPTLDDGDAALLVLSTPTTMPSITLPTLPDTALLNPGTGVGLAGWGLTAGGSTVIPDVLNFGVTVLRSTQYCELAAQGTAFIFVPVDQLCTIEAPVDEITACNGDSGGPLVSIQPDGQDIEIGLTIRVPADCSPDYPDWFTRIDSGLGSLFPRVIS